jgi:hypothetical protein
MPNKVHEKVHAVEENEKKRKGWKISVLTMLTIDRTPFGSKQGLTMPAVLSMSKEPHKFERKGRDAHERNSEPAAHKSKNSRKLATKPTQLRLMPEMSKGYLKQESVLHTNSRLYRQYTSPKL